MKNISYGSKVKLIWGVSKNQGGLETILSLVLVFQQLGVQILPEMTLFQRCVVRVYRLAACTQHFFIFSSNTNELMFERVWGTEYSFIDRQPNQKKGQNAPNLATPSGPKRVRVINGFPRELLIIMSDDTHYIQPIFIYYFY